jgi:hypothetical protein
MSMYVKSVLLGTAVCVGIGCINGIAQGAIQAWQVRDGGTVREISDFRRMGIAVMGLMKVADNDILIADAVVSTLIVGTATEVVTSVTYPYFNRLFPAPVPPAPPFVPAPAFP